MKKFLILLFLFFRLPTSASAESTGDILNTWTVTSVTDHFDPVAATNAYTNSLSAKDKAMSDKYYEGNYRHMLWGLLVEILVAVIFLFFGLSGWMRKLSRHAKNVNLQNLIYIILYIVFAFVLTLPYSIYKDFVREHHFGLSNMSFGGWFGEELTNLLVNVVLLTLLGDSIDKIT